MTSVSVSETNLTPCRGWVGGSVVGLIHRSVGLMMGGSIYLSGVIQLYPIQHHSTPHTTNHLLSQLGPQVVRVGDGPVVYDRHAALKY